MREDEREQQRNSEDNQVERGQLNSPLQENCLPTSNVLERSDVSPPQRATAAEVLDKT